MRTINNMLQSARKVSIEAVLETTVDDTKEQLLALNKQQMYSGKLRTGQDITPSYLDDPYFKSTAAAQRYSDWKDEITPDQNRKKGTPNLFINGAFYDSIGISVGSGDIKFDASFKDANSIESKFTANIYGLGGRYKSDYLDVSGPHSIELLTRELNRR